VNLKSLVVVLTPALLAAAFDTRRWQFLAPLPAAGAQEVTRAPVSREVFLRARPDLADLRVIRDGEEVPYAIRKSSGTLETREWQPALLDKVVVGGAAVQLTLDFGRERVKHSRVVVTTREKNFRNRVRVETGDDNHTWSLAREDGYIFDFSEGDVHAAVRSVDYPVSTRRYARLTVFGFTSPDAIAAAAAAFYREMPVQRVAMAELSPTRSEDPKTRASLLAFDLGRDLPHDRIVLETSGGPFHRAVELEASEDGKQWRHLASGSIFRVPGEDRLALEYSETAARYLRLKIFNGDNQPVEVRRATFEAPKRDILFRTPAAGRYLLYAGNPDAVAPSYDLPAILARTTPSEEEAQAGAWELNPLYDPPPPPRKPISERFPGLLPTVLVAAVLIMGFLAVQLLKKAKTA
jgi:uncharacterized protein DUF3999